MNFNFVFEKYLTQIVSIHYIDFAEKEDVSWLFQFSQKFWININIWLTDGNESSVYKLDTILKFCSIEIIEGNAIKNLGQSLLRWTHLNVLDSWIAMFILIMI